MLEALHRLPTAALRALASSLAGGVLSAGITRYALQQAAGPAADELEKTLRHLQTAGMTPSQMAVVVRAIGDARDSVPDPSRICDLVLSGPDLPGVPTADTAAVVHSLITRARTHVLLVGYAIHNGRRLFEPLAARMEAVPGLRVTFCIDIARAYESVAADAEIVARFAAEFRLRHWPWPKLPDIYFDPRSLNSAGGPRSSLHAKCVVVDCEIALVTSANFTEAAQHRNIEAGVLVRHSPLAERIQSYFEGLIARGDLRLVRSESQRGDPCCW